jgi:hypothetical protein
MRMEGPEIYSREQDAETSDGPVRQEFRCGAARCTRSSSVIAARLQRGATASARDAAFVVWPGRRWRAPHHTPDTPTPLGLLTFVVRRVCGPCVTSRRRGTTSRSGEGTILRGGPAICGKEQSAAGEYRPHPRPASEKSQVADQRNRFSVPTCRIAGSSRTTPLACSSVGSASSVGGSVSDYRALPRFNREGCRWTRSR